MSLSVGDLLDDRYELLQRLGEGGQAEVWKARDRLRPAEPVALKLIALARTPESGLERLRREAAALHALSHPSLVRCHRAFEDLSRKLFGLVLEYFEGSTVEDALTDPRFAGERRERVMRHLAGALAYLHGRGVVHRDLKPENVLLGAAFWREPSHPEHLKLIDLGIAALEGNPRPVTDVGRVIGTVPYMAPEVIDPGTFRGQVSGAARDVFAFGVMGWMLLAGQHPTGVEEGDMSAYAGVYRAAERGAVPWPQGRLEGVWGRLLRSCCALRAEQRPRDGVEIVAILEGRAPPISAGAGSRRGATAPHTATAPHLGPRSHAGAPAGHVPTSYAAPSPDAVQPSYPSIPFPPPPVPEKKGSGPLVYVLAGAVIALGAVVLVPRLVPAEGFGAPPDRPVELPAPVPSQPPPSRVEAPVVTAPPREPAPPVRDDPPPQPTAQIPRRTLADNPFAAACCVETECELTSASDAYFTKWKSQASDGVCNCPSQAKLLGCCDRRIPRGMTWSLRLSNVIENDPNPRPRNVLDFYPEASVCVKRTADANAAYRCKPLADTKDPRGVTMGVRVTTEDLEQGGLDIAVFEDVSRRKYVAWRMGAVPRDRPLGPITLCIGLRYIKEFTSKTLKDPSVSFFLDSVP